MTKSFHKPRLSVVIPSQDTKEFTLACLTALFAPLRNGTEVIVVDDCSADGTVAAVRESFPEATVLVNKEPSGFSRTANRGLATARGDILLVLNSDTELDLNARPRLLEVFQEDPRLGVLGAVLYQPDGGPQWSGGRKPSLAWLFAAASGLAGALGQLPGYRTLKPPAGHRGRRFDWVSGAAMAMRRRVWNEIGPFDEDFRFYCQDLDFCLRAKDAGWKIAIDPHFRVVHHLGATIGQHDGSISQSHPELLWTDLLLWAQKRKGRRWARAARQALKLGATLRILVRTLVCPLVRSSRRDHWRQDTMNFQAALAAIR